jgi:hypothetical protein
MEDAASAWTRERTRILQRNLTNPDLVTLLREITERLPPYGPLQLR